MVSKIQPLPEEIEELVALQNTIISQCDGEIASLQVALNNWSARRNAAQIRIEALQIKYKSPSLEVWPTEIDATSSAVPNEIIP